MKCLTTRCGLIALAAAWTVALGNVQAQDSQDKTRIAEPDVKTQVDRSERNSDAGAVTKDRIHHGIGKINKATGIVGAEVINNQNERLGSIKDIVLDLDSGRVGYAVLSVGGFLGIGDRLIAVPVNAFSISGDQSKLVLDADKAKLKEAPALMKDEWPAINDPQIITHWGSADATAVGTSGTITVRERGQRIGNDGSTVVTDQNRLNDRNESDKSLTRVDPLRENQTGPTFAGRITMIDPEKRIMRVQGDAGTREFSFTERPILVVGGSSRNPSLVDFKVGYNVSVGYHEEDDNYKAHSVIRTDPPSTR